MSSNGLSAQYDRFRVTFFEECAEMLAASEESLNRLKDKEIDRDEIDAIFRCVHSIKAGAGAFQYGRLVSFSHQFEYVLDRLRDDVSRVTPDIYALLVQASDCLTALVIDARDQTALEVGYEDVILQSLKSAFEKKTDIVVSQDQKAQSVTLNAQQLVGYTIDFYPKHELFRHANEPLWIMRELRALGELIVHTQFDDLPKLEAFDPENAYLKYNLTLQTQATLEQVTEAFEFVTEDAYIDITPNYTQLAGIFVEEDEGFGLFDDAVDMSLTDVAAAPQVLTPPMKAQETRAPELEKQSTKPIAKASPTPQSQSAQPNNNQTSQNAHASIRVDLERVDRLVNMVGEMVISQSMLKQEVYGFAKTIDQPALHVFEAMAMLESLTRELQDCVMAIRMQPVKSVFSRMPRLVREISQKLSKSVNLIMSGEQTELDKTVIEELNDPLTHMIRNSIDHGLESPEDRVRAGKPLEGTIRLSADHVGSNIVIHLSDDGAGINRERVYNKAVEKGIIAPNARLSDDEICALIFAPGFSTAEAVTDVSGRGVGMDVVRRNVEKIGGRIMVNSVEGQGTRFTLIIPLTLAVLDGMLMAVGGERYIVPLTSIVESFVPNQSHLRDLVGGETLVSVRGDYYRLVRLSSVFEVKGARTDPTKAIIVLVETASGAKIGLMVDELIGQQQVVIKSLQENYQPISGLSGATILGDGQVALILDVETLSHTHSQNHDALAA